MSELKTALEILDLVRPAGGSGQVVDLINHPRAYGSMGLAPFEVESTAVEGAREVVEEYLEQYPEGDRVRIRRQLWKDYHDIQSVREAGIDLSFLDEEFGKIVS